MAFYPFNINKIPEDVIPEIRTALDNYDLETLTFIHNKYRVSDNFFCCPDPCMIPHFTDLIIKLDNLE